MTTDKMTQADRAESRAAIRRRAKIEKQKTSATSKQLIANADAEMDRQFTAEDLRIKHTLDRAAADVAKINAWVTAQFDAMGVATELRSYWSLRQVGGGYRDKDHRSELRRKVRIEVAAWEERRFGEIDAWEDLALTALAKAGMTSDAALAMLESLPPVDEALPAIDNLLGPVEEQPIAVIENTREGRRQAVLRALDADGSRSDREIGRLLGMDHKTVGKIRAHRGELSNLGGEFPESDGELPGASSST